MVVVDRQVGYHHTQVADNVPLGAAVDHIMSLGYDLMLHLAKSVVKYESSGTESSLRYEAGLWGAVAAASCPSLG
jgi:hypothetical protein